MAARNNSKTIDKTTKSEKSTPSVDTTKAQPKPLIAKDIDIHQYVTVRNGFQGKLVYQSQKTGEHFVWDGFGTEQEMELLELRNAKNSSKKFFENNWFMFDEDWVLDYLGLNRYYKHAVKIEDFDKIFELSPDEIKKTVGNMTNGQRKSVAYRVKQLISNGDIDSNKVVSALEDVLGIELTER